MQLTFFMFKRDIGLMLLTAEMCAMILDLKYMLYGRRFLMIIIV